MKAKIYKISDKKHRPVSGRHYPVILRTDSDAKQGRLVLGLGLFQSGRWSLIYVGLPAWQPWAAATIIAFVEVKARLSEIRGGEERTRTLCQSRSANQPDTRGDDQPGLKAAMELDLGVQFAQRIVDDQDAGVPCLVSAMSQAAWEAIQAAGRSA